MSALYTAAQWLQLGLIAAHVLFLTLTPFHLRCLYRASIKVHLNWQVCLKIILYTFYAVVQLLALVLLSTRKRASPWDIDESALSLSASLTLLALSPLAHRRSLSPSTLVTAYLLARFICYSLYLTVQEPSRGWNPSVVVSSQLLFTLMLLLLELQSKRSALLHEYVKQPPETVTSFLGNWVFLWINPILREGYTRLLTEDGIPILDEHMSSKALRLSICATWDAREKPETGATLPRVLLGCLLSPFLAAILPRVFVILFRFAQPLLMSQAIRFVTNPSNDDGNMTAYWIIIAAATVYTGMAVSASVYRHRLNRLQTMIRGALVGLLHSHTLETRGSLEDDGRVVTLMSNDIGNVQNSGELFHETWGQFVEVVVGTIMLAIRVGWLWPLPLVLIFLCSRTSRYVARTLRPAQGKWNNATQQRISVINSMLGSIKNIKMLGLQQNMEDHVEYLRNQEMHAAAGVRWLTVVYNMSANALGMFGPVATIVAYAAVAYSRGEDLDPETAFTSIAILAMITHPANMIMTIVPQAVVSYSGFERIQRYLLGERLDQTIPSSGNSVTCTVAKPEDDVAIKLDDVDITNFVTSKPILQELNVEVPRGSIVVLTGSVGSGKTTLLRAILGEIVPSSGSVQVSPDNIAYCSQLPWLPNESIRDAICGPTVNEAWDETWYRKSIQACCLDSDLDGFAERDFTIVGSQAMNLSGGQRQRVALARAVYSRAGLVLLDDSFNALDGQTQGQVVENLLGQNGIFRQLGATVVWCTTKTRFFRLADEVIVLSNGKVKEKGSWNRLRKEKLVQDDVSESLLEESDAGISMPLEERNYFEVKLAGGGINKADLTRKNGDLSLYNYYCRAAGLGNILTLALCAMSYGFFITFPPYWLKWWTESLQSTSHIAFYMTGYVVLLLLAYTTTIYGIYINVLRIAPASGTVLHHRLLTAIVGAPLLYFSEINTGTILNHFSEDIHLVDKQLADAWTTLNIQAFKLLVQACLIFASQPLMTLSLPFSVIIVYIVQKLYLRTSRQLRILELESRAAIFSSFLETVQGASTIRAFGWESAVAKENITTLDSSQRPFYLLLCLQRWLNVVLDLIIAGIAVGTIWLAVGVFRGSTTGGQIGVALNVILVANSTLLKLVESWTNLEISLGAVARLKEVDRTTPSEEMQQAAALEGCDENDEGVLPRNWPSEGAIEFSGVNAAYDPSTKTPPILKSLSLKIKAGQTVVICGRTGSGKSSFLLSLLRLIDLTEGKINIDGVDISYSMVSKTMLRERIFITVAQEAFFLPQASLQFNLDPELKASPSIIVDALMKTDLWKQFFAAAHRLDAPDEPANSGNDESMPLLASQDYGSDKKDGKIQSLLSTALGDLPALSAGQTQLLALARALVRKHVLTSTTTTTPNANPPPFITFSSIEGGDNNSNPDDSLSGAPFRIAYNGARIGATKPIVLLDEVTSSLDPVAEAKIYDVLEQEFVLHGHTIVMVTHKLEGIRGRLRKGRDKVVWMAGGEITGIDEM